jgi:hypothetical protein
MIPLVNHCFSYHGPLISYKFSEPQKVRATRLGALDGSGKPTLVTRQIRYLDMLYIISIYFMYIY